MPCRSKSQHPWWHWHYGSPATSLIFDKPMCQSRVFYWSVLIDYSYFYHHIFKHVHLLQVIMIFLTRTSHFCYHSDMNPHGLACTKISVLTGRRANCCTRFHDICGHCHVLHAFPALTVNSAITTTSIKWNCVTAKKKKALGQWISLCRVQESLTMATGEKSRSDIYLFLRISYLFRIFLKISNY